MPGKEIDATPDRLPAGLQTLLPTESTEHSNGHKKQPKSAGTTTLCRGSVSIVSPLRYAGAKRRFASYVQETLKANNLRPKLFIEPFAGGASVSLQLLKAGMVDRIALGELDPYVASFWKTVFFDTEWLIDTINEAVISLDLWTQYKHAKPQTVREHAWICLYLNRTSFSGLLTEDVGPIGGKTQKSKYTIDCRFTKATIIKRIRSISALREKVEFVECGNWQATLELCATKKLKSKETFFYFDPPFYHKAPSLYRKFFQDEDHKQLHDALIELKAPWLLSYDNADKIRTLYSDSPRPPKHVELLYTGARSQKQVTVKELVYTNLSKLPQHNRLWRTSAEWGKSLDKLSE